MAILAVLSATNCAAQELSLSARGFAMGDANIADTHDVTAMYYNPAALVSLKSQAMYMTHFQRRDGTLDESFALPITSSNDLAVAMSTDILTHGLLSNLDYLIDHRFAQLGYEVGAATAITSMVTAGGSWTTQFGRTNNSKVWASSFSGSVNYFPTPDVNYTLAFDNIGKGIQFSDSASQAALASGYDGFASWQIGAQMQYPTSASLREPIMTVAFDCQKFFNRSTIYYKAGVEVLPIKPIALRAGYIFADGFHELRTGVGFTLWKIKFDYSIAPGRSSAVLQVFSASFDADN